MPVAIATLFAAFIAASAWGHRLPAAVPAFYFGASLVTFLLYARDKSAARNDRWRTRERTLHLLGLLGGWPGALIAQNLLRHKSKKRSFRAVFWCTVLLNCAVLLYFVA